VDTDQLHVRNGFHFGFLKSDLFNGIWLFDRHIIIIYIYYISTIILVHRSSVRVSPYNHIIASLFINLHLTPYYPLSGHFTTHFPFNIHIRPRKEKNEKTRWERYFDEPWYYAWSDHFPERFSKLVMDSMPWQHAEILMSQKITCALPQSAVRHDRAFRQSNLATVRKWYAPYDFYPVISIIAIITMRILVNGTLGTFWCWFISCCRPCSLCSLALLWQLEFWIVCCQSHVENGTDIADY
jgi:hypothetical protein